MGEKTQLHVQNTTDLISMLATDISISSQIYVTVFIEKRQYYNNVSYEPRRVQKGAKCSRNETRYMQSLMTQIQTAMRFLQLQTSTPAPRTERVKNSKNEETEHVARIREKVIYMKVEHHFKMEDGHAHLKIHRTKEGVLCINTTRCNTRS